MRSQLWVVFGWTSHFGLENIDLGLQARWTRLFHGRSCLNFWCRYQRIPDTAKKMLNLYSLRSWRQGQNPNPDSLLHQPAHSNLHSSDEHNEAVSLILCYSNQMPFGFLHRSSPPRIALSAPFQSSASRTLLQFSQHLPPRLWLGSILHICWSYWIMTSHSKLSSIYD